VFTFFYCVIANSPEGDRETIFSGSMKRQSALEVIEAINEAHSGIAEIHIIKNTNCKVHENSSIKARV
jgi:hypothetical protein